MEHLKLPSNYAQKTKGKTIRTLLCLLYLTKQKTVISLYTILPRQYNLVKSFLNGFLQQQQQQQQQEFEQTTQSNDSEYQSTTHVESKLLDFDRFIPKPIHKAVRCSLMWFGFVRFIWKVSRWILTVSYQSLCIINVTHYVTVFLGYLVIKYLIEFLCRTT